MAILVVNGPNLNRLGQRDPAMYGKLTLDQIYERLRERAGGRVELKTFQSNHEGALIDFLQLEGPGSDGVILNAGSLTHYSYALHDALAELRVPVIEVHLSNVHAREEWRRHSVIAPAAKGVIAGLGWASYLAALEALLALRADG
jgi:3-dehydroquinate dehydratase-2